MNIKARDPAAVFTRQDVSTQLQTPVPCLASLANVLSLSHIILFLLPCQVVRDCSKVSDAFYRTRDTLGEDVFMLKPKLQPVLQNTRCI
jgi:hypothetical protein